MKELRDYRIEDDRPEMIKVASCVRCHDPIYDGDTILDIEGELFCENCRDLMTRTIYKEESL